MSIAWDKRNKRWRFYFDRTIAGQRARSSKLLPKAWSLAQARIAAETGRADFAETRVAELETERERLVPVGWQYRYVCGEDGIGPWRFTSSEYEADIYRRNVAYETREVFALAAKEPT